MKIKLGLVALSFFILTGFTACEERRPPQNIVVSESLLMDCPEIPLFSNTKKDASLGSQVEYTSELMTQYALCRTDKHNLNKVVRRIIDQKKVD